MTCVNESSTNLEWCAAYKIDARAHLSKITFLMKRTRGMVTAFCNSTKRLYDNILARTVAAGDSICSRY